MALVSILWSGYIAVGTVGDNDTYQKVTQNSFVSNPNLTFFLFFGFLNATNNFSHYHNGLICLISVLFHRNQP